jgi:hypothetical protein
VREWRGVVDDNGAKGEGKKKIEDERMSECQSVTCPVTRD